MSFPEMSEASTHKSRYPQEDEQGIGGRQDGQERKPCSFDRQAKEKASQSVTGNIFGS